MPTVIGLCMAFVMALLVALLVLVIYVADYEINKLQNNTKAAHAKIMERLKPVLQEDQIQTASEIITQELENIISNRKKEQKSNAQILENNPARD